MNVWAEKEEVKKNEMRGIHKDSLYEFVPKEGSQEVHVQLWEPIFGETVAMARQFLHRGRREKFTWKGKGGMRGILLIKNRNTPKYKKNIFRSTLTGGNGQKNPP